MFAVLFAIDEKLMYVPMFDPISSVSGFGSVGLHNKAAQSCSTVLCDILHDWRLI